MKYFKVQKGYGADDFIAIDETELPAAIRAQVTGKVAIFKEGTVSGNAILSIVPDYGRELGYNRDYKLMGEDYGSLGTKTVIEYRELFERTHNIINRQLGIPETARLQKGGEVSEEVKRIAEDKRI